MRVSCHYHMRHVIDYHALNSSGKFLEILRVSNVYFVDSSVVGLRQLVELPKFFKPVYRAGSDSMQTGYSLFALYIINQIKSLIVCGLDWTCGPILQRTLRGPVRGLYQLY